MKIFGLILLSVGTILLVIENEKVKDDSSICDLISDNRAVLAERLGKQLSICEQKLSAVEESVVRCVKREKQCM